MSYVTGISGNVISAASAGFAPTNSADVSAIASAYATGGVDSATVSAIASAYQVVSSLNTSDYQYHDMWVTGVKGVNGYVIAATVHATGGGELATKNDISGVIDTVSSNSASWAQAGVDSATVSAIASSYAESAVSSKLDESATADFYSTSNPSSFVDSAYVDSAVSGKLDSSASSSFYSVDNPSGFITGVDLSNYATTAYVDSSVSSKLDSSASSSFYTTANESGFVDSAYVDSAVSGKADSSALSSYALSSDVSGVIDTVSSNSASWGGGGAQIVTATGSAAVGYGLGKQTAVSSINGSALLPYGFSAISGNSGNWNSTRTAVTANSANWNSVYNTVNSSSASWGGGGIDSATCSAIASSYAESAASSKMDSSAIDYTRTGNGTQIYASGTGSSTNQFSATNDSAGVAIIAGGNARLRLWDTAATANLYASSIGGWNSVSNLVSTQSANWGGSALALSAGPGVKLELSGSTLVASTDETVLYSATAYAPGDTQQSYSLSETPMNFETVRVLAYRPLANGAPWFGSVDIQIANLYNYSAANTLMGMPYAFVSTANKIFYEGQYFISNITSTSWEDGSSTQRKTTETAYTTGYYAHIYKIIGINRTAGV